jgi:hypothetical protein
LQRIMVYKIGRYVPAVKEMVRQLPGFRGKPDLAYLETHLTEHCNLNCKGCSHLCPLAPPWFADLRQHETDMRRLSQLFNNITKIRLMGGEPLLHPDAASFITVTRAVFPEARIHFVTNGMLLPKAPAGFWEACRNTNTTIDLSLYPLFRHRIDGWRALCKAERVSLRVKSLETFYAVVNPEGDSDKHEAFSLCRRRYYCPYLKEGRLYPCVIPASIHYFNRSFGYQIASDRGINIHARSMNGRRILKQLDRPTETCRWCRVDCIPFSWSLTNKPVPADWTGAE